MTDVPMRGNPRALTRAIGLINRSLLVRYSVADLVVVIGCRSRVSYPRVDACLYTGLMPGSLNIERNPEGVAVAFCRSEWMECSRQA